MRGLNDLRPNRSAFRRAVMSRMCERGHDAGMCKATEKEDEITTIRSTYINLGRRISMYAC